MSNECQYCDRQFDSKMGLAVHKGRSHNEPWTDKETFRELRIEEGLSTREMAERWGCGRGTVSRWGNKHGIEIEDVKPWRNKKKLERLYVGQGMSAKEISEQLDCGYATVLRWLQTHGIPVRRAMQDNDEPISAGGYQYIPYWKDDMLFHLRVHRLVAYAHRMIDFDELFDPSVNIHHKNGNQMMNAPENLEVMERGEHSRHHFDDIQES